MLHNSVDYALLHVLSQREVAEKYLISNTTFKNMLKYSIKDMPYLEG